MEVIHYLFEFHSKTQELVNLCTEYILTFACGSDRVVKWIRPSSVSPHHEIKFPVVIRFKSDTDPALDDMLHSHSDSGHAIDSNFDPQFDLDPGLILDSDRGPAFDPDSGLDLRRLRLHIRSRSRFEF
ncbi:hypothetical protein EVAR_85500_1 [Eumeta japonica]|uniref:Uncharacterized protein n=1 Tax=Eumeta variegata TaxID=151549 RepID=A0A4C1VD92_EUMVA|nr:hypothetical protein EVAR_85500_1 [Eumeta japonica]